MDYDEQLKELEKIVEATIKGGTLEETVEIFGNHLTTYIPAR